MSLLVSYQLERIQLVEAKVEYKEIATQIESSDLEDDVGFSSALAERLGGGRVY